MKRNRTRRSPARSGFTLLEVLLVLIILVVIAGFAIQNFTGIQDTANKKAAVTQIGQLSNACKTYQLLMRQLPPNLEALVSAPAELENPGEWTKQLEKVPLDPWNRPYEYKVNGSSFEIRSVGPDGQSGTSDDITNS
jgi:general secretion pathway protein G